MDRKMYLGPNRPFNLPINNRSVFIGDPEKTFPQIEEHFEEHPEFKLLFVPVDHIPAAKEQLKREGTKINRAYAEIKKLSDQYKAEKSA